MDEELVLELFDCVEVAELLEVTWLLAAVTWAWLPAVFTTVEVVLAVGWITVNVDEDIWFILRLEGFIFELSRENVMFAPCGMLFRIVADVTLFIIWIFLFWMFAFAKFMVVVWGAVLEIGCGTAIVVAGVDVIMGIAVEDIVWAFVFVNWFKFILLF